MEKPIKRKSVCKTKRELVYSKYDGHCAYCGCSIPKEGMTVDHLHSYSGTNNGHDVTDDVKSIENMMPCCFQCNSFKADLSLEDFRTKLKTLWTGCNHYSFKIMKKYHLIRPVQWDGQFYFEKMEEMKHE